ncbi:TlpA disulfide reductase family protein [Nocardiopsis tropica]|uniref:TlpA disulfide reductase family protein n=1 Tax=Nocardiopsis tropica TaxID=109330 RepID=A0ABU7KLY5_9ACTN|nr:TlpA disulfide reductase family protein [Nocardiopsis umidischolae]MEE2049692.1 TlpA disulfide reductase family protein [Nocardiopsis umidischolae]
MPFHRSSTIARPRPTLRAGAAALVLALALASCANVEANTSGGADTRYIQGDGSETVFAPDERMDAPEVSGETLDGDQVSLDDYRGDVLVLNIWASWCVPCRTEIPVLKEVYAEHQDAGLEFLGVNIKDDRTAARAFVRNLEIPYPSIYDQPGEVPMAFRDTVPPRAVPSTIVIDHEGRIAARVIGETTYTQLSDLVDPVLAERNGEADPT